MLLLSPYSAEVLREVLIFLFALKEFTLEGKWQAPQVIDRYVCRALLHCGQSTSVLFLPVAISSRGSTRRESAVSDHVNVLSTMAMNWSIAHSHPIQRLLPMFSASPSNSHGLLIRHLQQFMVIHFDCQFIG